MWLKMQPFLQTFPVIWHHNAPVVLDEYRHPPELWIAQSVIILILAMLVVLPVSSANPENPICQLSPVSFSHIPLLIIPAVLHLPLF
jgi:hypothetical protein